MRYDRVGSATFDEQILINDSVLDFLGDRYAEKSIHKLTNWTFEQYKNAPDLAERIADEKRRQKQKNKRRSAAA